MISKSFRNIPTLIIFLSLNPHGDGEVIQLFGEKKQYFSLNMTSSSIIPLNHPGERISHMTRSSMRTVVTTGDLLAECMLRLNNILCSVAVLFANN